MKSKPKQRKVVKGFVVTTFDDVHSSLDGSIHVFANKGQANKHMAIFGKSFIKLATMKIKRVSITIED